VLKCRSSATHLKFYLHLKKKICSFAIVISVHNKESADKLCLKAGDNVTQYEQGNFKNLFLIY